MCVNKITKQVRTRLFDVFLERPGDVWTWGTSNGDKIPKFQVQGALGVYSSFFLFFRRLDLEVLPKVYGPRVRGPVTYCTS